jgi:hypothetical protein
MFLGIVVGDSDPIRAKHSSQVNVYNSGDDALSASAFPAQQDHNLGSVRNGVGRLDEDLANMTRQQLLAEVQRLREGIRAHRDASGHELCWHHPELWSLLPEKTDPLPTVPDWPQFLEGCIRYRKSLDTQAPDAPRTREAFDTD